MSSYKKFSSSLSLNIDDKRTNILINIFHSIESESSQINELNFNTANLLSIYIRRNRDKVNKTLKEISNFFNKVKINTELLI